LPAGDELRRLVVKKPEILETTEPNGGDGTQTSNSADSQAEGAAAAGSQAAARQDATGSEIKNPS
jgi:hypothetical protein